MSMLLVSQDNPTSDWGRGEMISSGIRHAQVSQAERRGSFHPPRWPVEGGQ